MVSLTLSSLLSVVLLINHHFGDKIQAVALGVPPIGF